MEESQQPFLVDEEEHEEVVVEAMVGRKRDREGAAANGGSGGVGSINNGRENNEDANGDGNGEAGHQEDAAAASRSSSSCCTESGVGDEAVEEIMEADKVEGGAALFSVHFDKEQGYDCIDEHIEQTKGNFIEEAIFDTNIGDLDFLSYHSDSNKIVESDHAGIKAKEKEELSGSDQPFQKESPAKHGMHNDTLNNEYKVDESFDFINEEEVDMEGIDYDVERVLAKQNTHDLYCPNCHSCITRKVILRRRKRKVGRLRRKQKLTNKPETVTELEVETNSSPWTNDQQGQVTQTNSSDQTPPHSTEEGHTDKDVDGFRCLSCFSFFIPTGSGFKLFRTSKSMTENETVQLSQDATSAKTNWFFSIFTIDKTRSRTEEGINVRILKVAEYFRVTKGYSRCRLLADTIITADSKVQESNLHQSNAEATPLILPRDDIRLDDSQGQEASRSLSKAAEPNIQNTKDAQQRSSSSSSIALPNQHDQNGHLVAFDDNAQAKTVDDTPFKLEQDGSNSSLSFSSKSSVATVYQKVIVKEHKATATIKEHVNDNQAPSTTQINQTRQNVTISTTIGIQALENVKADDGQKAVGVADGNLKAAPHVEESIQVPQASSTIGTNGARIDASISSPVGVPVIEKVKVDGQQKDFVATKKEDTGSNLVVVVESVPLVSAASQRAPDADTSEEVRSTPQSGTQGQTTTPRVSGVGIDILKSIVYGGLIETITSLGVVSSAAGGGAATMNILALGLANLIGGLFVIFHNLFDLKSDRSRENSDQASEQDRYQVLLGRRGHFTLHATVAILSYLIFGLLPPVIYGVMYRKSDNRDYKLAAVGTASLICIILLAIGKAHVQRQRSYIKTMLYYVILGVLASGASYVVGDLIDMLLKRIGWSESSSLALTMTFPESGPPKRSWSSY